MSEKAYLLVDEEEELPSDWLKGIKGVEVPMLQEDEKNKMEELVKRLENAVNSVSKIDYELLEEIHDIQKRIERLLEKSDSVSIEDVIRRLDDIVNKMRERDDSNEQLFSVIAEDIGRHTSILNDMRSALRNMSEIIKSLSVEFDGEENTGISESVISTLGRIEIALENKEDNNLDDLKEKIHALEKLVIENRESGQQNRDILFNAIDETKESIVNSQDAFSNKINEKFSLATMGMDEIIQRQERIEKRMINIEENVINSLEKLNNSHLLAAEKIINAIDKTKSTKTTTRKTSKKKPAAKKTKKKHVKAKKQRIIRADKIVIVEKNNESKKLKISKKIIDEEYIHREDHIILNALSSGRLRGPELSRKIGGDAKMFRARMRILLNSGKVLRVREGKFVYYMLA